MKTKIKVLMMVFTFGFILQTTRSSAQTCTYHVSNMLNCVITGTVSYYKSPCPTACGTATFLLTGGTGQNFMCSLPACAPLCDVRVDIDIPFLDFVDGSNPTASGSLGSPCSTSGFYYMTWSSGTTVIQP